MKLEEKGNWTTVTMIQSDGSQVPSSKLERDATTSYATNRETVYHKNARTVEETHLIKSAGSSNQGFSEEHWSSEIKSFVTAQPPKFIQVIKAFRVLATDTLTLVVEVESDPPAIFEWFCNDRSVQQDKRRFKVRHGLNITTLTVEGPEQGVYKCTARNPAGISTTYGYITVNAQPQYQKWTQQKHAVVIEESYETTSSEQIGVTIKQAPKFVNGVPNLTLKPGAEAIIDVEVDAYPPAKFTWYVNGYEFRDSSGRIAIYYPKENRCVARFPIPQTGEYKVVAENSLGKDQSIGYIDIKKEISVHQTERPPLPVESVRHTGTLPLQRHQNLFDGTDFMRSSSVSKNYEMYEESSYYQRSTSLPRPVHSIERHVQMTSDAGKHHEEEVKGQLPYSSMTEIYRAVDREDGRTETLYRTVSSESTHTMPQPPKFTSALPKAVSLSPSDELVLSVDVKAAPQADIKWKFDGSDVKESKNVTILSEHNRSTLIAKPPVQQGRYSVEVTNEAGTISSATTVHRVEEETFEQVDEHTIISERGSAVRSRSSPPPEIVENAITVTSAQDGWELVDRADLMKSSSGSVETVKHVETSTKYSVSDDRKAAPPVPPKPAPVQISSFTYTQKVSEESGDLSMKQSAIIPQPKTTTTQTTEMFATEMIEERRQMQPSRKVSEPLPKRPQVLRQPPPEVHVKAGEKLVLESKVDSYPESSFKWYQNNFEVRPSASVQIEAPAPNESRAIFKKPTDGIYKVTASNVYGSCTSSTRVTTEVVEEMLEESSVSIIRTPAQQVQPQQHIQKFQFVRKGRVEPRKDLPKVPKIHKKFASLIRIPQHKPLVLSVEADAIPEATFTWRVNNFEVRPSALVHIERPAPNVCRATFTKPSEGRYEVIASNERGTDVCSTKVAIDYDTEVVSEKRTTIQQVIQPTPEPPVFVRSLPPRTQLSDTEIKEFQLNVLVDSQQPVTFRWFADGSLLSNSVEHQMINEAFESTLLVRQPIRRVRDYSVEVSNASGTIRSTTSVYPPITTRTSSTIEELLATEASTEVRQRAPRFTTPLYATELEEGERLTAEVVVDHDGAPCEFLWYLNGKDVRTQPGFRVDSTHYVSTLVVESVNARTDGKLSVIATNRYGTAESSATITVNKREDTFEVITVSPTPAERPPKIVSPLHSTVFTAGQPMTLRCHIDALPPAQIIWTKDEVDLAEWVINEDITTNILPDGTYELTKPECTPDDAGLYECSARNAYGTAQTAAYVTVEEMVYTKDVHEAEIHEIAITKSPSPYVPQEPPRFTETMTSEIEDEKTVLKCKVHSEAPVEISWYHNNVPLTQNEKYTMRSFVDGTQTLSVRDVSKRDEGVYMCRAESRYGVAETSSQVITKEERQIREEEVLIEEHTDEQIQLPQRTDFQKKVYTDTSVKLISETEITDSEENYSRTAELKKNEEEYKLLVKVAETVAKRLVANIVIEEAVREAAYRIREQIHTSDEEEIFIERTTEERTYAPRFETNIECQTVRVGDTVRFATDVRGHPTPRIHWYFGQQRIQQSDHTEVLCLNGRSTLVIRRVTKEDEGVYFCEAENRVGKAVLSCDLRVIDTSTGGNIVLQRFQSTLDFSRTAEYVSTETETEVHSNILVNHSEEAFEHRISFLQPRTISLGYDCRASTSKVYDDSVIIRREERRQRLEPAHKEVTLNVNVEKPTPQFKHDVQILQQRETDISMLTNEQWFVSSEEVMQTRDITLTEKQKRAYGQDSTVNISTTIVIEKPSQRALHEVICIYDERVRLPEERFHAVRSVELRQMEEVNELFTSVLARKDEHQAHEVANVEVRRPPSQFDHTTTVMESEVAHLCAHYTAPTTSRSEIVVVEVNLVKYSPVLSDRVTRIQRPIRRATAEQRIVILEGVTESFSEEVFWSLKKIQKAVTHTGEAITNANIEVRKPFEQGEHITTIIDKVKIIPEILAIAAAATKIQITNVYITLTKKGEVAHQALVIEYESYIEDEASLNIALLTVPAFHSKQEEIWTRETRIKETYDERNIVAVFVEVDANCPNQSVELVASVNIPVISNANLSGIQRWSTSSVVERSDSITESSSYGVFEAPRFLKQLENVTTAIGNALQFKCIVSGMPMPEIRWFVDGDEIHTSRVYETVYEDGVCILRINEVVLEDEGEYMCEATNPSGRAITKCFLHTTRFCLLLLKRPNLLASPNELNGETTLWRRSLSKKSISEETNSYVFFEAVPAAEAVEVHAILAENDLETPLSSIHDDSRTTVGTVDAFDISSADSSIARHFSFYDEPSNVKISATFVDSPQRSDVSAKFRTVNDQNMQCIFDIVAYSINESFELIYRYPTPNRSRYFNQKYSTSSYETCLSLHLSRPNAFESAAIIALQKDVKKTLLAKLAVIDTAERTLSSRQSVNECCSIILALSAAGRTMKQEMTLSCAAPGMFSNDHSEEFAHSSVEWNLTKQSPSDNDSLTVMSTVKSPTIRAHASINSKELDLWNESFDNPFPEEASLIDQERLLEPRTPLLPEKVTYRGQEIGLCVREMDEPDIVADKPKRELIEKYVEALFDFSYTVEDINGNGAAEMENSKNVDTSLVMPKIVDRHADVHNTRLATAASEAVITKLTETDSEKAYPHPRGNEQSSMASDITSEASNNGSLVKTPEGTVITEEDIDMFRCEDISELIMETIEEAEDSSQCEDVFEAYSADGNQFVEFFFQKPSQYGEATENRGIGFPSPSDMIERGEANKEALILTEQQLATKEAALESKTSKHYNYSEELNRAKEAVKRTEAELDEVRIRHRSISLSEEAQMIERAIYDISDRIMQQQPLTEAQAEANEELLRATLEEMIMDVNAKPSKNGSSLYKKPIALLRQKLANLEHSLIADEEVGVIMGNNEDKKTETLKLEASSDPSRPSPAHYSLHNKKRMAKRMSSELARMTPLTNSIHEQLSTIETMLDEVELDEFEENLEGTSEDAKLLQSKPTTKRREMHGILVQINHELNTMKRYCRKNISRKGADAVVGVLQKVRGNVSSIVSMVSRSKKKRRSRTKSPDKHTSKTGFFFGTEASINFNLFKSPAQENVDIAVMYRSTSDGSTHQSLTDDHKTVSDSVRCQYGYKVPTGSDDNMPTPKSGQDIPINSGVLPNQNTVGHPCDLCPEIIVLTPVDLAVPSPCVCQSMTNDDDVPVRPPRPRRSQSREAEEKRLIEMLASQASNLQETPTIAELNVDEIAEIARMRSELEQLESHLDDNKKDLYGSDVISENETQELEIRRRTSVENVSSVFPLIPVRKAFFTTLDENSSVQLFCEESDYGNESDTGSRTFHGSAKVHPSYALSAAVIPEQGEKYTAEECARAKEREIVLLAVQELANELDSNRTASISTSDASGKWSRKSNSTPYSDVEIDVVLEHNVESSGHESIECNQTAEESDQTSSFTDIYVKRDVVESCSLNDIESLLGRDESGDEANDVRIMLTSAPIADMVNVMPTIMERSENSRTNSAMTASRSSATTTTDSLLPRVINIDKIESLQASGYVFANPYIEGSDEETIEHCESGFLPLPRGKSKERSDERNIYRISESQMKTYGKCDKTEQNAENVPEEICIDVNLKRRPRKLKVLCTLAPEVLMNVSALATMGESVEVVVEQPSESQGYLVKITDDVSDSVHLSVIEVLPPVSIDVEVSLSNDEQTDFEEVVAVQPDRYRLLMKNLNDMNAFIYDGGETDLIDSMQRTGVSISIVARSTRDAVYASLEEIPWGEVSMHICLSENEMVRSMSGSETRANSLIQNVTVSESNDHERKSLRSQESFKSSQKSLAFSDRSERYDSMQSLNVPSYVLKEGSTATITCELNNFLSPNSHIDWYKGKAAVETKPGKIDRISHDLLEVLVISHVELDDSDVYSIEVDEHVYPVAFLIVEEDDQFEKADDVSKPTFITPPQTLFVMEGQPAIISCQLNGLHQNVVWCKERKVIDGDNHRFKIESDDNGLHRLIIGESELDDQGTYYAYVDDRFTAITLVVEVSNPFPCSESARQEQINERELTVTASGTESEEDDYREYVVPPGSTATIACELESDDLRELCWRKDGENIVFDDDSKVEHVVNGLKHYLVIHDTQPNDSACYSVRINNAEFKVAHMIVSNCATSIAGDMAKEETLVPAGASAVIHCETITQEKSLIWQKDRRPLSHDDRYEYSDSADGHEHSFTIHGVRKSDEGEYGVIISEAYTAVTNITVIDSDYQLMRGEEATTTHYFSVPMKRPTFVSEATMNSVEQRHFYDEYQVCDVNEYFDLHFRTQSYETPVVVRESRSESVALSCSSRESSTGRMEEEIVEVEVKRHEWQKAAKDVTVLESHVLQTTCEMSLDSTDYDVSIELAPFYGRVTMVEKVVTPTPRAFASIQIAQRCIDADLFRTNVYGMLSVESIRWMPRYESGVQMSVSSTRSETVELGAIIGCGTENEQISVVLLTSPPISHVSSVACSYAQTHLWTELCAEFVSVVNTEISRLISNDTAVVARLDSTTVEDIESVLRLHRDESKELLNAVVTTLPEPIFVHFSDNVAYTELSQWLNSTVIRGDYSEITRKLIRTCSEHIYLQESSLEEQFSSVDCHQEYAQEMAECILKPHLVPKTAEVSASFANEQVVFSLDSAVVRQTGSNFVAKMINTAKEWICLQETTIEDNYSDIFIECATSYQDCFISLMSRPSPETVQVVSEIALQKAQYFFDWSVDECVERRFIARVMRNAFISMQLRGITIEEGTFDVLIGRRWEREQLQVTVLVPARAAFENAKAGFAFEGVNYLMESFEVRSIESDFVVKVSNTLCLSVSMCASTTEEIVTHIEKEQNNSAEHALVTVIPRPPPHHAEVITDIASQEFNNFFDSSLVQRIEQRTSVIIFRQAYTSMQLHRTLLEEGDFGVWMGRILEQDEAFVTVICRPPPINARVSASIETQETSYFFDSFVDQQVEFKVISKVRRKAFTSMQLHAETLEEGEFDVLMGRRWDREEVNITLISHPPPVHASVQLTLEVQEASYFFDSFTDQRVELNVRSKLVTRAFTSMQLHAVKLEEGIFDVFLIRTSNPVGTSILLWHRPLPISAHVMSHIELQEASYLFDSFVDETVECKVLSRVFTRAFTTMRLHATSIEDGQFSVFMVRKTEEEEIFVSVAAPTTSSRTETRAGFACFQMSYLFDSEVARGIRRYLRTKGTHRAKASLSLCAAKSQRDEIRSFKEHSDFTHERMLTKSLVDFIADQDRSCNFSGERHLQSEFERLGATVTEGYDSSTVMLERTYQESTHVRISAEPSAQGISAAAYEYAHTQLRASAFKEAEFHTSLNRRSESDELSVTVVSPLYSHAHHEMALSMVSKAIQEDEMQRTAIEEECGKIVGEIASDEEVSVVEDSLSTSSQGIAFTKPQFIQRLNEIYELDEETSVTFKCIIGGVPSPSVRWFLNNTRVIEDRNVSMIAEDGIYLLRTKCIDCTWNGTLVCEAINSFGCIRSSSRIVVKGVQQIDIRTTERVSETQSKVISDLSSIPRKPSSPDLSTTSTTSSVGQAPEFQQPLAEKTTVKIGEILQLKCVVSGSPLPTCQWTRNGVVVEQNSENTIISEDGICILRIRSATLKDSAVFRCTATNTSGTAQTESTVFVDDDLSHDSSVSEAPHFILPLKNLEPSSREHVQLKCIVSGSPMPSVRWTLNGRTIEEGEKGFEMACEDGIVLLRMTEKVESGIFVCQAVNSVGQARTECRVQIKEPKTTSLEATVMASNINFLVDADVFVITKINYETKATIKMDEKPKKTDADFKIIIIIEESIIRTRKCAKVIERRFKIVRTYGEGEEKVIASGQLGRSLEQVRRAIEAFLVEEKRKGILVEGENLERIIEVLHVPKFNQATGEQEMEEFDHQPPESRSRLNTGTFTERMSGMTEQLIQRKTYTIKRESVWESDEDELMITDINCICAPPFESAEANIIVRSCVQYSASVNIVCRGHSPTDATETFFEIITEGWVTRNINHAYNEPAAPRFVRPFSVAKTFRNIYELRCTISGYPSPSIRILHNGIPIRHNDRRYRIIYECGIVILRMLQIREGHYVCEASNSSGKAITECYLKGDEQLSDIFEVTRVFDRHGFLLPSDRAPTSYVALTGQDSVHRAFQYPALNFGVANSLDMQRFSKKEMTFERLSRTPQRNEYRSDSQYSTVKMSGDIEEPFLRTGISRTWDQSYSDEHVSCTRKQESKNETEERLPTATDSRPKEGTESSYATTDGTIFRGLTAEEDDTSLMGKYGGTKEENGTEMIPYETPNFPLPLTDIVTEPVDFIELRCIVIGHPEPKIRFIFNDHDLQSDLSAQIIHEDGVVLLRKSGPDIEGHYICEATNQIGTSKTECHVYFKQTVEDMERNKIEYFERKETRERITRVSEHCIDSTSESETVSKYSQQQRRNVQSRDLFPADSNQRAVQFQVLGHAIQKSGSEGSSEGFIEEKTYLKPCDETAALDLTFGQKTSADVVEVDMIIRATGRIYDDSNKTGTVKHELHIVEEVCCEIKARKNEIAAVVEITVIDKIVAGIKKRICDGPHQQTDMDENVICDQAETVEVTTPFHTIPTEAAHLYISRPLSSSVTMQGTELDEMSQGFSSVAQRISHMSRREYDNYLEDNALNMSERDFEEFSRLIRMYMSQNEYERYLQLRRNLSTMRATYDASTAYSEGTIPHFVGQRVDSAFVEKGRQLKEVALGRKTNERFGLSLAEEHSTSSSHYARLEADRGAEVFEIVGERHEKASVVAFFPTEKVSMRETGTFSTVGTAMSAQGETLRENVIFEVSKRLDHRDGTRAIEMRHLQIEESNKEICIEKDSSRATIQVCVTEGGFVETTRHLHAHVAMESEAIDVTLDKEQQVLFAEIAIELNQQDAVWFALGRTMIALKGEIQRSHTVLDIAREHVVHKIELIEKIMHPQMEDTNKEVDMQKAPIMAKLDVQIIDSMIPCISLTIPRVIPSEEENFEALISKETSKEVVMERTSSTAFVDVTVLENVYAQSKRLVTTETVKETEAAEVVVDKPYQQLSVAVNIADFQKEAVYFSWSRVVEITKGEAVHEQLVIGAAEARTVVEELVKEEVRREEIEETSKEVVMERTSSTAFVDVTVLENVYAQSKRLVTRETVKETEAAEVVVDKPY
ncbi:unnamed protein product, partial [Anisakis simplex]|uniref:Titin n=1 Tax=Anisakis simplex TaxID=6269 RepID=A0A0M3JYQ0_ANISI